MAYDWKKQDKTLYLPKGDPVLVDVPLMKYFKVSGQGAPEDAAYQDAVAMLFTVSYTLKMWTKKNPSPLGWYEYAVFPFESAWQCPDGFEARSGYIFDAMIRQPDFLTPDLEDEVIAAAKKKKPDLPWRRLESLEQAEGHCVQMLHLGPYADEDRSFAVMDRFCLHQNLVRRGNGHKEIYLNDPTRTAPEKLKTVLRYWVKNAAEAKPARKMIRGRHG
ncbi:MAG: GyrI-like domain-containing protein [Planctomycetaceae bacterium]|nr:GyrI-like domain-containing protein [Planctomycetaceae bacterium]